MYCENCGAKNESDAKFCSRCGQKLEVKKHSLFNKIKELPRKTKIAMGGVFLVLIIAMGVLAILLNNPVKKVSDKLDSYYVNYEDNYILELKDIGNILKDNKKNEEVLNKIRKASNDKLKNWVKNFNTSYDSRNSLDKAYQKLKGLLTNIYNYYNGLDYILNNELYNELINNLNDLYNSKVNYLYGKDELDEYSKYLYYERVIDSDSYYKETEKYITDYVKEELDDFINKADQIIKLDESTTNMEKYNAYKELLEYLEENKIVNNLDVSNTKEYKEYYNNAVNKINDLVKDIVEEKEKSLDYHEALEIVNETIKVINNEDLTKDLDKLKEELEEKLPDKIVDKFVVSYDNSYDTDYSISLNDKEYEGYIQFSFNGEEAYRVFRLNKDYKKFKAEIIVGENWPADFKGEVKIISEDKELFASGEITKDNSFKNIIDIDVTDIDDLKIEFITNNDGGLNNYYLFLVKPYLYK